MSEELHTSPIDQTSATEVSGAESIPVPLGNVEKELNRRIQKMQEATSDSVLRSRMSNLVVYCDNLDLAGQVDQMVTDIVSLHPARVLLLLGLTNAAGGALTTTVTTRCHPVSNGRALCSEQVTVRAVGTSVKKLPFVVRGLLVGDLPTNLWWAASQAPPLDGVLFHDLAESAEQVVYDSMGWPDPARGMLSVINWMTQLEAARSGARWRLAADLNWRRLKYWRRILTQALDPQVAQGFLNTIREVQIDHGPHAVIQAWLVVSWLAARLGWEVQGGKVQPNVEMSWQCRTSEGLVRIVIRRVESEEHAIHKIHIASEAYSYDFAVDGSRRLSVVPTGGGAAPRTVTVPPQPLPQLVGRELSDRDRDPGFRESLEVAKKLAQSVVGL
ncbi:MAG: glucose-6-phosphate dehydrogenase assembly protein OpcA [Gemmataceae bacterium]